MALTFRTGSDGKGSALTIEELDNNFRYFTGSHSITGSLEITGDLTVEGSIINDTDVNFTGSFSGSFDGVFSGSIDGSEFYISNLPTSEPAESGRLWLSGSSDNSKYLMVRD